jgi:NADH dehydrogenase/NADH:ubiquinone oxidoreductase subunit G
MVERLASQIHAELILMPEEVNLKGALQMGITKSLSKTNLQQLEVLHLIGEAPPADLSSRSFILYQNFFPPAVALSSALVLPAAAFTEENGTFINHAGEMRSTQKAVPVAGNALPSWQILCRLAQKLGVAGFEYENEGQIRAEIESMNPVDAEPDGALLKLFQPDATAFPLSHTRDHGYMGFPLGTWVKGFQCLLTESKQSTEQ